MYLEAEKNHENLRISGVSTEIRVGSFRIKVRALTFLAGLLGPILLYFLEISDKFPYTLL